MGEQGYISIREGYVDITRWAATTLVHRAMLEDGRMKMNILENGFMVDMLLFRLEAELLKDTHGRSEQEVSFWMPATWWDHFKHSKGDSKFWGWLARKFPVKGETKTVKVMWECASLFPEASYYPPQWGKRVKFVGVEQRWEEE